MLGLCTWHGPTQWVIGQECVNRLDMHILIDLGAVWFLKNHHSLFPLNFHHLSLITYHWKYHNFLRWHVWHLFPILITQKILLFCGTYGLTWCSFYFLFLFLFSLQPPIPKLIEPSEKEWKKKRKKKKRKRNQTQKPNVKMKEKKKKKKRRIEKPNPDPVWKKKRKEKKPTLETQCEKERKEEKKEKRRRRRPDLVWKEKKKKKKKTKPDLTTLWLGPSNICVFTKMPS